MRPIFITGNQNKVDRLNELLGFKLEHKKIELDEIQSLHLERIVEHKARQAYGLIGQPVLVEDVALGFTALSGLPGPFIKFFVDSEQKLEMCCRILDGFSDRSARAQAAFGYYDGTTLKILVGGLDGEIARHPSTAEGWDWDKIFCPVGYEGKTRAELSATDDETTYLSIKPVAELKKFLRGVEA